MQKILRQFNNVIRLDINKVLNEVFKDKTVQQRIISINTFDQLFDEGINAVGVRLDSIGGEYAINTIEGVPGKFEGKRQRGLPYDHITLFDTGDYYQSHYILVFRDHIEIKSNPIKGETNLYDEWGDDIVGIAPKNIPKVANIILPLIRIITLRDSLK